MSKSILQIIKNCSVQKTAPKNTKYSRNENILKISHPAKAIANAKSYLWLKKWKFQKTCQTPFSKYFKVALSKKPLQKTPNIRQMKTFWKSAIMQRLYPFQNPHFGSNIKILKNMSKSILQILKSCSVQKIAPKNTKYSRKGSIFKNSHHAKAHAKSSLSLKH